MLSVLLIISLFIAIYVVCGLIAAEILDMRGSFIVILLWPLFVGIIFWVTITSVARRITRWITKRY